MDSQLFQIQDSLSTKPKKRKKPRFAKAKSNASVSMGFYDDLAPISVTTQSPGYVSSASFSAPEETQLTDSFSFSTDNADLILPAQDLSEFLVPGPEAEQPEAFTHTEEHWQENNEEYKKETDRFYTGLSENEIAADLSAINKSSEPAATKSEKHKEEEKEEFFKKLLERNKEEEKKSTEETKTETPPPAHNQSQNIFDAIAKSMNYANAFDLGDYVLEQRFNLFDNEEDKKLAEVKDETQALKTADNSVSMELKETELPTKNFIEDLDIIQEGSKSFTTSPPEKAGKNWPAPPADLEQPTGEKTKQLFGEFQFETIPGSSNCEVNIKGSWESDNIVAVEIPQLIGKTNGTTGKPITKGVIRFNKKAHKQLERLWKAWEDAKLLDRIITYDGGFVPRFKKRKGGVCATSLSNHAWGTAFDINAEWNGMAEEPALVGQKGCVRELVEIANKHGFYWGGHFNTKDGMHFEAAKIID